MESIRLVGALAHIGKAENVSKNPAKKFIKREFVIDTADDTSKYPNPIPCECIGDACGMLDAFSEGQIVSARAFLNGRKWDSPKGVRYFVSVRVTEIALYDETQAEPAPAPATEEADAIAGEDLPF